MREKTKLPILVNYDDSSDEDDDYNSGQLEESTPLSHILEDEGRRVLYSAEVRRKYYVQKESELACEEGDFPAMTIEDAKQIFRAAIISTCKHLAPNCDEAQITPIIVGLETQYGDDLQRLILKQSENSKT